MTDAPQDNTAGDRAPVAPVSRWAAAWCGLRVALIGSVLVGLAECSAAGWVSLEHYAADAWPWRLLFAAAGKAVVTHVLAWGPLFALAGLLLAPVAARRSAGSPLPILAAGFVLLTGCLIAPFDLLLAERDTVGRIVGLGAAGCVGAVLKFLLLRRMVRRRGPARLNRMLNRAALAACAILVITGGCFVRSPLLNPAGFVQSIEHAPSPKADDPHVLWIVLDTVRADHMSLHGYARDTTPRLAAFAKDALVFDRAIANGIWTLPSHTSMFTGQSVWEHGADHRNPQMPAGRATVAEVLSDHGYATAVFSNNPWVAPPTGLTRGFDDCHIIYHLRHVARSSIGAMIERWGVQPPLPWLDEDFGGALTNRLIADWLAQHTGDRSLFLFVNYMDAHLPYRVPRPFRAKYMSPEQVHRSYALAVSVYGKIVDALDRRFNFDGPDFVSAGDLEILKRQYDAGIAYVDHRVGELLELFEQRGLLDNTLVVIASDHGEYLDTHGMWAHRMQAYQDVLGVTVALRPPNADATGRVEHPVLLSDLYGTVLHTAVGAEAADPAWHARDLLADYPFYAESVAGQGGAEFLCGFTGREELIERVERDGIVDRIVISEYGGPAPDNLKRIERGGNPVILQRAHPQIAVQDARYKLLVTADGTRELYDLAEDPGELHNLIDVQGDEADRLSRYLESWHARTPRYQPADGDQPTELDPDVIRALKSLGYLGDND
jgi:arylsulfatase A-like enzyme